MQTVLPRPVRSLFPFERVASAAVLVAMAALAAGACGGAADSPLFRNDVTAPTPVAPTTTANADAGATDNDSGAEPNPEPSPADHPDASILPAKPDASPPPHPPDASPPATGGIVCMNATCTAKSEVCCRTPAPGSSTNYSYTCTAPPPTGCTSPTPIPGVDGPLAIPCDDATDCAAAGAASGSVCCGDYAQNGRVLTVVCRSRDQCNATFARVVVCTPSSTSDTSPDCPNGKVCRASVSSLKDYSLCLDPL